MRMGKLRFLVFIGLVLSEISFQVTSTAISRGDVNDEAAGINLRKLAYKVLDTKALEQYGEAKGAAASSPFGVGYMLANINTKIWNISTVGFDGLLEIPSEKISEQYATLLEKLNQGKFSTKNVLYVRNENDSVNMPIEAARELKTELVHTDYVSDWKNSWHLMNGMIANQSGGRLDDQLLAKGGWYGGSFYTFTAGAYINTIHKKAAWHKSWTSVGEKKFSDGVSLPYYQVEGKYSTLENEKSSMVLVPIKIENKDMSAIFILPKGNLTHLTKEDLAPFFTVDSELSAKWRNTNKRAELPAFNITLLSQHCSLLQQLGLHDTFCLPDREWEPAIEGNQVGGQEKYYISKRPYFANPIAQATHIEISPHFVEVASATGMSVTSIKKFFEYKRRNIDEDPDKQLRNGAGLPGDKVVLRQAAVNDDRTRQKRTKRTAKEATMEKTSLDSDNALIFNKPFIWLIHDSELGTLFYGSVNSFAQYENERKPQEGFEWRQDTEKSIIWTCP